MTRILALDLATTTGVAYDRPDDTIGRLTIGLCDLAGIPPSTAARRHGALFIALEAFAGDVLRDGYDVVAIEDDTGRNKQTAALLAGYRAIVTMAAAKAGVRVISDMKASDARKAAGVPGGGSAKDAATNAARRLYQIPATASEDEVDAEILLHATRARLRDEEFARLVKAKTKRRRAA